MQSPKLNRKPLTDDVLSVAEAAALLGITTVSTREAIKRGTLPSVPRVKVTLGIKRADVLAYGATRRRKVA